MPPSKASSQPPPSPPSPPGVYVDKQTSLLLAPPSWAPGGSGTSSAEPSSQQRRRVPWCQYQDYLEEDMQTLLSDWTEQDAQDSDDGEDDDNESVANSSLTDSLGNGAAPPSGGEADRTEAPPPRRKSKKKKWRKLKWRPPSMARPPSAKSKNAPLPPLCKRAPQHLSSNSSAASITSRRSNASLSSMLTTKSTATQKHSNRTVWSGASSVRSSTPPLARYRRLSARKKAEKSDNAASANSSLPPRHPTPPRHVSSPSLNGRGRSSPGVNRPETSPITIMDDDSPLTDGGGDGASGMQRERGDDATHVTVENLQFMVAKNYDAHEDEERVALELNGVTRHPVNASCVANELASTGSEILVDLGNVAGSHSPKSVSRLSPGPAGGVDDKQSGSDLVAKALSASGGGAGNDVGNGASARDGDTVSTFEGKRVPGPVDVDTCAPCLTPAERRNLRAMHAAGYAHLRDGELSQALAIFSEILRGQKERHGKRSLPTAVAMHNLGVVCMRTGRHAEAVRLCDGAARIRAEELGMDALDVATSLAQQGVALMELGEHELALASFVEALRIRRAAWGEDCDHPLIVRLLNNVGCALFEVDDLEGSREAFEEALGMQRGLMRNRSNSNNNQNNNNDIDEGTDNDERSDDVDPKDAYHTLLSIALALTNLGSIHLRLREFDKSLVCFEEAVLIQESVLGEDHKIVTNTKESINFVFQAKEEQETDSPGGVADADAQRIGRLASILPKVGYERGKRIYAGVHSGVAAAIDVVSSTTCDQRPFSCAEEE